MSSRPQFNRDYIQGEFDRISNELGSDVTAFLVGGGAMSFRGLKDTTKDIDLVVTEDEPFQRLLPTLTEMGYEELTDPGEEYETLGARLFFRNGDGCQIDLFNRQIANKLIFSQGMESRSEVLHDEGYLTIRMASLEDIFLFKSVAERPDDIDDMATLVQTGLEFDIVEEEMAAQVELLGSEYFTTVVSESLVNLDERHGIQTPLDEIINQYYHRFMDGFELLTILDKETPRPVSELAGELELEEAEIEERFEYLKDFGFAKKVADGILDTGERGEFKRR